MPNTKKPKSIFTIIKGLVIVSVIVFATVSGCSEDKSTNTPAEIAPQVELASFSDCKENLESGSLKANGNIQTCVEFVYDSEGTLHLNHVNMTANCCADDFTVDIDIENGVVTITEEEIFQTSPCYCICQYDIEMEITDLPPGTYTISIIEPYQYPDSPALEFGINLTMPMSGQFCINR